MTSTHGLLDLTFDVPARAGVTNTRMTVHEQRPPLKVVRAFTQDDGAALVHLHNVSGGVLAGDELVVDVRLEAGACVQLTTTGATRLYRRRADGIAHMRMHATVAAGGLLEYLPDAIIPFRNANVRQSTHIELAEDAGVLWWDMVAPGREAMGERFDYDMLELEMRIDACGLPIAMEHVRLCPDLQALDAPVRMGGYGHYATFYACRVGADIVALEAALLDCAQRAMQAGEVLWGASALSAHGVAVRGLARTSRALQAGLNEFWATAKTVLYRRAAIMPRKIY
ncbi:MAG: urease accessory protein UreD [Chloroflexi bacterium]|nr:urease accessory protein UreD [Chloroflexota bacterium]